jgi:hypothetical protein
MWCFLNISFPQIAKSLSLESSDLVGDRILKSRGLLSAATAPSRFQ